MNDLPAFPVPPAAPGTPESEFGPEIARCRRVSGARAMTALGFRQAWVLHYVLGPFLMIPYMCLMMVAVCLFVMGYKLGANDDAKPPAPVMIILFLAWYAAAMWFWYILPMRNELVLHERGIRIRFWLKRLACSLDDIDGLFVGRAPSSLETGLRSVLSIVKPQQMSALQSIDGTALTVYLRDGGTMVFKTLLTHFEPADLQNLFQELANRNPRFQEPPP